MSTGKCRKHPFEVRNRRSERIDDSEARVIQFIADSQDKVTFANLSKHFCTGERGDRRELKRLLTRLVNKGRLCYQSHLGNSIIELSYEKPVTVSERVVLKPPKVFYTPENDQQIVTLQRGASFGGGEHPSTRLAIQLIDLMLGQLPWRENKTQINAVDIGTGCGVLAVTAARLGVGHIYAVDLDPCAVFEAKANVRLNGVEAQVDVSGHSFAEIPSIFDLVLANLRTPTLLDLRKLIAKKTAQRSALVFSGMKADECEGLRAAYAKSGFFLSEKRQEKGWCSLYLIRSVSSHRPPESLSGY